MTSGSICCLYLFGLLLIISPSNAESQLLDPCLVYTNCQDCLYNSLPCGWCGTTEACYAGDASGPTSLACPAQEFVVNGSVVSNQTASGWQFTESYVMSAVTDFGSKVSPSRVEVFLRPGHPVTIPFTLRVPIVPPIDFFFLLDASVSMRPYITLLKELMPQINGNLTEVVNNARALSNNTNPATIFFGMGSYIEKPVSPFGSYPEAYVLKVHTGLVNDSDVVITAMDTLLEALINNYEHPENPLEAALTAGIDAMGEVNWRKGSFHIVMTCTDASAHVEGDGKHLGIYVPNNYDGIPDGFPPGSEEDYPSLEGFKLALIDYDINPIFGAINHGGVMVEFYQNLSETLDFGAYVEITNSSETVVQAILNGTLAVLSKAIMNIQYDDKERIENLTPNHGVYTNVTSGSILQFYVTVNQLVNDTQYFGETGTSIIKYVGFGDSITITTYTAVDCLGCALNNPNLTLDVCDVCGGDGKSCLGCDGKLPSNGVVLVYDYCGVCGGDNQSCLDCFGEPIPPGHNKTVFDLCGVCGGNNSACRGCDGVVNSGLVWNECNQCGVPCNTLTTVVVSLATVAVVGIIAAAVAIFLLCASGAVMVKVEEDIFDQEAKLHENPLYEQAKTKFDNLMFEGGANEMQ